MLNPTKPFTPSEIMTAGKIARFAMKFNHFDDVIAPVFDHLVASHPKGKGYDPEEAYLQFIPAAGDAIFGYHQIEKMEVPPQYFHVIKAALARLLEFSFRQDILESAGDINYDVRFDCDREIGVPV